MGFKKYAIFTLIIYLFFKKKSFPNNFTANKMTGLRIHRGEL